MFFSKIIYDKCIFKKKLYSEKKWNNFCSSEYNSTLKLQIKIALIDNLKANDNSWNLNENIMKKDSM